RQSTTPADMYQMQRASSFASRDVEPDVPFRESLATRQGEVNPESTTRGPLPAMTSLRNEFDDSCSCNRAAHEKSPRADPDAGARVDVQEPAQLAWRRSASSSFTGA